MTSLPRAAAAALLATTAVLAAAPGAYAAPAAPRVSARVAEVGSATAGRPAAFSLKLSTKAVKSWSVDFGDRTKKLTGRHAPAARVRHTFRTSGWRTVTLTVTPAHGRTVTSRQRVLVLSPAGAQSTTATAPAVAPAAVQPAVVQPNAASATSYAPHAGAVNTTVTITGSGFTSPATASFNGVNATTYVTSPTTVTTYVPPGAATGPLTLTTAGSTLSVGTFTVTLGIALSATAGPPTTGVTVTGSGFAPNEAVDVYTGTTAAAIATADANGDFTEPGITVPASAQPGRYQVSGVGRKSGSAAQAAFTVQTDSVSGGFGPQHKGVNPYENTLTTADVSGLGRAWSATSAAGFAGTPAVVKGAVYAADEGGTIHSYNAATGASIWAVTPLAAASYSSPAVANGVVYVGTGDGKLTALNTGNGSVKWASAAHGYYFQAPQVANGLVYVAGEDSTDSVYAYNATTGAPVWSFAGDSNFDASPVVSGNTVYVASSGGTMYALNAATGAEIWSYAATERVEQAAAVANGAVYFGTDGDHLIALDATSGSLLFSYTAGGLIYASPAVVGGLVYFGASDATVDALNATTGGLVWKTATGGTVDGVFAANGVVYAGSYDHRAYGLDASSGRVLWTYATGGDIYTGSPVVTNGTVYVGSESGVLTALTLPGGNTP